MNQETSRPDPVEILLVDDREENLLTLEAVLDSPEYHLVRATSGDSALRYLLDHSPALILMDVQMPRLDGFATASIIKGSARTRDIPIIFLTAIGKDERFVHKGYEHGAVDYMAKPFDSHILRSKVAVFADLFRKSESLLRAERRLRENEKKERERKIAELEIRSLRREQVEQKKYRDLVEGIEHGIVWSADPKTLAFSFVSKTAERLLGYSLEQWYTEAGFWSKHILLEDREAFVRALQRVQKTEEETVIEHRFRTADGKTVWLQTGIRPGTGTDGEKSEINGLSFDITKTKEAGRLLRAGKQRSDILAQAGLMMAETFDYVNSFPKLAEYLVKNFCQWAEIGIIDEFGDTKIVAVTHSDPLLARRAVNLAPAWQAPSAANSRAPVAGLYRLTAPDALAISREHGAFLCGLELSSAMVVPLVVRGKNIGHLTLGRTGAHPPLDETDLELGRDLAFRIAASADNWRLYKEAQTAISIRDEFLSIASHELKTPLTPLKIQTQQLLRLLKKDSLQNLDPEKMERMLLTSNRQIERLSKLIDDLLDISRISMGKLHLQLEDFNLMEMIADVAQRFSGQLASAGCQLLIKGPGDAAGDAPDDAPDDAQNEVMVHWDLFRMEQVLVNLLTNAMKYGPGQPIEIRVESRGGEVTLAVKDNGIGVAPADQARIFQRFERAVSGTHFGGLGLGLYIVTQILEAHGGTISVRSQLREGAIFSVKLPAVVVGKAPPLASAEGFSASVG